MKTMCRYLAAALVLLPLLLRAAEPSTLEQRLQVLEDKEAIRTLLLDYGRHLDNREWEAFSELFAENGSWNGGMGIATGHEAIVGMMVSSIGNENVGRGGNGLANLHLFANERIEVDGDRASALTKWVFFMTAANGGPDAVFVGHYEDTLVRERGAWKFAERVVHGDIMRPTTVEALNGVE